MKAVIGTGNQRNPATTTTLAVAVASSAIATHRASRAGRERRFIRAGGSGGACAPYELDDDRLGRDVVVAAPAAGLQLRDLVDDVHAAHHAAEDRIAETAGLVIEGRVVDQVDGNG